VLVSIRIESRIVVAFLDGSRIGFIENSERSLER